MYLENSFEKIRQFDPEMADLTVREEERQKSTICLIASENYASPLAAGLEGTIWADKNAEGYPGGRFVAGCELADAVENLAKDRIKKLFGAEHANVQAMSATIGNVAILRALLQPGDTILSMELDQGGHLSHGARFHYSGKMYNAVFYGLSKETEEIDMEQVEALAKEHKPKVIICGASSYPKQIDYKRFGKIAKSVGAYMVADIAHPVGLIAAEIIPSPFPYADVVTTSTHKTWRGSRGGGIIMCKAELAKKIDSQIFPGLQGAPKMDMIAARAVQALESITPVFKAYQQKVYDNAKALADELLKCGLRLVSGGTNTHLILVDVRNLIPSGKEAEEILESVGIVVNKNMIPYDPQSPKITSGIRIGTPAMTTRGMEEEQIREVGQLLAETLKNKDDETELEKIRIRIKEIAAKYPLFDEEKWLAK
ncbi:MAG: serine hydroxymethyltransferase [Lachnospiraceae bacterium]